PEGCGQGIGVRTSGLTGPYTPVQLTTSDTLANPTRHFIHAGGPSSYLLVAKPGVAASALVRWWNQTAERTRTCIGRGTNPQVIGASEIAKTREDGRIAAEWCRTCAMVRRSSCLRGPKPRRRETAGGGVMASGNRVLPGSSVTTERAATAVGWASEDTGYEAGEAVDQPQRTAGRGAGGRWLVWVLRAVVWVVLLLIGYRGIAAIVTSYEGRPGSAGGAGAAGAGQSAGGFPVTLASAFALEFGQVYL